MHEDLTVPYSTSTIPFSTTIVDPRSGTIPRIAVTSVTVEITMFCVQERGCTVRMTTSSRTGSAILWQPTKACVKVYLKPLLFKVCPATHQQLWSHLRIELLTYQRPPAVCGTCTFEAFF